MERLEIAPHRSTPPDQVHLTLQFIGPTDPRELEEKAESVERSASGIGAFELTPVRFITLPQRGRPRLVALETDAPPGLLEIQRRLAHRLASKPRRDPGDRFLPHLTLCRFTHRARPRDLDQSVEFDAFQIDRIALMRSILRESGAEHSLVREFPLEG